MSAALIPLPVGPPVVRSIAQLADLAVLSLPSPASRRNYARELRRWLTSGLPLDRTGVQTWIARLRDSGAQPGTLSIALAAVRLLAREACIRGLVSDSEMAAIDRIRGVPLRGTRLGNWLDIGSVRGVIDAAGEGPHGTRNQAIVAVMLGCGLRRAEVAALEWEQWQRREGRWVWADLKGKGAKVRTVPCPAWAAEYVEVWRKETETR